jgi:molybdopterin-containing oxidoreductase family membrane subunit
MYFGLHGKAHLAPWLWMALIFNLIAFALFLSTRARENPVTLNLACSLVIVGVYVEKGMGLVIPGFIPGTLGEIYQYTPTNPEILITISVWAVGALLYTLMLKFAIPVYTGKLRFTDGARVPAEVVTGQEAAVFLDQGPGAIITSQSS